ncbi:MAG: hypothetical protein NTY68_04165 [Candidatus Micrarchaeota archaeon]|nr:hypothetical protein [Candidatus Micrarchaeota archaeon]
MKYPELISYENKYGECNNDLLVIIPCFINYDLLVKHLGCLSRQTFHNFDVILILGPDFNDSKLFDFLKSNKFGFGIIVVKNKIIGTTCGFFIGQKYGYDKGYGYMIMADDDCMPVDPGVVGALYSKREIGCVCPTQRLVFEERHVGFENGCTNRYALFSRSIFKKYGFYYLPIYHGSEDSEFKERVSKEKSCTVPNFVEHPYSYSGSPLLKNPTKLWTYMLSSLLVLKSRISDLFWMMHPCILLSISLFFMPMYGISLFLTMTSLLLSFRFGKEACNEIENSVKKPVFLAKKDLPGTMEIIEDKDTGYFKNGWGHNLLDIMRESIRYFRKDALITNCFSTLKIFMLCALCRTVYLRIDDDRHIMMASNRNSLLHILKIILFPVFFITYCLIFMLLFVPLKILKQPKTMGYGLD